MNGDPGYKREDFNFDSANSLEVLGVDHTTVNPPSGRSSVRVSSKKAYTHGLIVADIAHSGCSPSSFFSFQAVLGLCLLPKQSSRHLALVV